MSSSENHFDFLELQAVVWWGVGRILAMQQVEFLDWPILSNSTFQYSFRNYMACQVQYISEKKVY